MAGVTANSSIQGYGERCFFAVGSMNSMPRTQMLVFIFQILVDERVCLLIRIGVNTSELNKWGNENCDAYQHPI